MNEEIVERVLAEDGETVSSSSPDRPAPVTIGATLLIGVLTLATTGSSAPVSGMTPAQLCSAVAGTLIESLVVLIGFFALGLIVAAAWSRVRSRIEF